MGSATSTRRAVVIVAEVLAAVVLAGLVWWCWRRGVIVTMRRGVALNRIEGRWWAAAAAGATLAGILLLDAGRQLAVRAAEVGRVTPLDVDPKSARGVTITGEGP